MPFVYPIKKNSLDSHQATSYWMAVIVPFAFKDTYNRDLQNPGSITEAIDNPTKEEDDKIIIDDDCVSWQTASTKGSHVSSLQLQLTHTAVDYVNKVMPGDWIIFWAFNDYNLYSLVRDLVKNNGRVNHFSYAPKFIGRIGSVVKDKQVSANGIKNLFYSVSCNGFSELDANMYYNTALGFKYPNAVQEWRDFGTDINSFLVGGVVTPHEAITKLVSICLGTGPGVKWKRAVDLQSPLLTPLPKADRLKAIQDTVISPNESYLIPPTISKLLTGGTAKTYADLLRILIGVQQFQSPSFQNSSNTSETPDFRGFLPDLVEMTGQFQPQTLDFNNTPIWSILQTYLNPPMNEMFTCLRVDADGYILPTLVARQIPFSTKKFSVGVDQSKNRVTPFVSLPRWQIDKSLIINQRTGVSNAVRFNYVQVLGLALFNPNASIAQRAKEQTYQKPIIDTADIQRSGLNTFIRNTNSYYTTTSLADKDQIQFWSKLMADTLFGSHLKTTGSILLKGVNEPICEGDNCVIDNVIYHIEAVSHSGQISPNGTKEFNTTLLLTNGISIESDLSDDIIYSRMDDTEDDDVGITFEKGS